MFPAFVRMEGYLHELKIFIKTQVAFDAFMDEYNETQKGVR